MPLLLNLAIVVVVLVILVLLYLTFVPIIASFRTAACLTVAELAWGLIGLRFRLEPGGQRLELLLVGLPIRLPLPRLVARPPQVPAEAPPAAGPARPGPRMLELLVISLRVWPDVQRVLVAVIRETHLRVRLGLVFGTGDAGTTGETFGVLMALRGITYAQPWFRLDATPVFDGPAFDWDADGEARVRSPIRVMVPALRLFLHPEIRAAVRGARS